MTMTFAGKRAAGCTGQPCSSSFRGRRSHRSYTYPASLPPLQKQSPENAASLAGQQCTDPGPQGIASAERKKNEALGKLVRKFGRYTNVEDLVEAVRREVAGMLECQQVTFYLVDKVAQELWSTPMKEYPFGIRLKYGKGIAGLVAERGKSYRTNHAQSDAVHSKAHDRDNDFVASSLLTVPVMKGTEVLGVLQALNKKGPGGTGTAGEFTRGDQELLESVAHELVVLHLQRLWVETMSPSQAAEAGPGPGAQLSQMMLRACPGDVAVPDIDSLDIDYFDLTQEQYRYLVCRCLEEEGGLLGRFRIPLRELCQFLHALRRKYRAENPFHNFAHGLHVFHTFRLLLAANMAGCRGKYGLSPIESFAGLLASLAHDVDHPGTNNGFQVAARSKLAIRYNDISVLENHHAATLFGILEGPDEISSQGAKDDCRRILEGVRDSGEDVPAFRKTVVRCILQTDMQFHAELVRRAEAFDASTEPVDRTTEWRAQVLEVLVHSADLGAQCLPRQSAAIWTERVLQEFTDQVEKESLLGIPVTSFMAGLEDPSVANRSQMNFIDFVAFPLWNGLTGSLFPEFDLFLSNLKMNRDHYAASCGEVTRYQTSTTSTTEEA